VREHLRAELLALRDRDLQLRQQLLERGELDEGYHPEMEAVHRLNAARLREIISQHGWPDLELVGSEAAEAAWLIAQHAIGEPEFMRKALTLIEEKVAAGKLPAKHAAYLYDRIAMFEGRPQCYGTNSLPCPDGKDRRWTTADPANLNSRRAAVGLPPAPPEPPESEVTPELQAKHKDWSHRYEEWLVKSGWRR
jgi:hypothetical protein